MVLQAALTVASAGGAGVGSCCVVQGVRTIRELRGAVRSGGEEGKGREGKRRLALLGRVGGAAGGSDEAQLFEGLSVATARERMMFGV